MAKVGDLIPKSGIYTKPGVVTDKKEDGTVTVSTKPMDINKYHRHMNTTGLDADEKLQFNSILDEIYMNDTAVEKVNAIQEKIDELKQNPKTSKMVQYLRNQQNHLIRESKTLPNTYQWDENQLKT